MKFEKADAIPLRKEDSSIRLFDEASGHCLGLVTIAGGHQGIRQVNYFRPR
jgi:hypothetical protein